MKMTYEEFTLWSATATRGEPKINAEINEHLDGLDVEDRIRLGWRSKVADNTEPTPEDERYFATLMAMGDEE